MIDKLKDLLKQHVRNVSAKKQDPFVGLLKDLKQKYKADTKSGNDIMELLHGIASGADSDNLDGLKTRLVRLDKLRGYLLSSRLTGQEQKTVYTAYVKTQSAIKKKKDNYTKKHVMLRSMVGDIGGGTLSILNAMGDDIPQLKLALMTGKFLFTHIKKRSDAKKAVIKDRQKQLMRDARVYDRAENRAYKKPIREKSDWYGSTPEDKVSGGGGRMMLHPFGNSKARRRMLMPYGRPESSGHSVNDDMTHMQYGRKESSGPGANDGTTQYDHKFAGHGSNDGMTHGGLNRYYGQSNKTQRKQGMGGEVGNDSAVLKEIARDVKIIAKYFAGQTVRDKDKRMDDLESMREGTKTNLVREKTNTFGNTLKDPMGFAAETVSNYIGSLLSIGTAALGTAIFGWRKQIGPLLKKVVIGSAGYMASASEKLVGKGAKAASTVAKGATAAKAASTVAEGAKAASTVAKGATAAKAASTVLPTAAKAGVKLTGKFIAKATPLIGAVWGLYDAYDRISKGDYLGAAGELASAGASFIPGYGTAAAIAIQGGLAARDLGALSDVGIGPYVPEDKDWARKSLMRKLNPFAIGESEASQFDESPQNIKNSLDTQIKADPSTMPAAIVPIAKLSNTKDLKDLLGGGSNGLGFIFSLKNINTRVLLKTMISSLRGSGGSGGGGGTGGGRGSPRGSEYGTSGNIPGPTGGMGGSSERATTNTPNGASRLMPGRNGGQEISGAMGNPSTGSSINGSFAMMNRMPREEPIGPTPDAGEGGQAISNAAKNLLDEKMETASASGLGGKSCVWSINKVFNKAGVPLPWGGNEVSVAGALSGIRKNGWTEISENERQPGDVWVTKSSGSSHIGVVGADGNVISNSSSKGAFTNNTPPDKLGQYFGGRGTYYRMPKDWTESKGNPKLEQEPTRDGQSPASSALSSGIGGDGAAKEPVGSEKKGGEQTKKLGSAANAAPTTATENILGQKQQFEREQAVEEWHKSNDPNKGTATDYLKERGLIKKNTQEQDSRRTDGKEGVDYAIDTDNGERYYFDDDFKNSAKKLTPTYKNDPNSNSSRKSVHEGSNKIGARRAKTNDVSAPVNVVNNNTNVSNRGSGGGSSGSANPFAMGTSPSFSRAVDITEA